MIRTMLEGNISLVCGVKLWCATVQHVEKRLILFKVRSRLPSVDVHA
jgi:hypothetical protein